MRKYEAVFVFRPEDEIYKQGKLLVQDEFSKAGASIEKEDDMGSRELAYQVKNENRGHYHCYEAQIEPEKITELTAAIRLMDPVLKCLFVRQ
jgi:small subunit ribosomal protein S6